MSKRKNKVKRGKHSKNNKKMHSNNRINNVQNKDTVSMNDIVEVVNKKDVNDELVMLNKEKYTKAELEEMIQVIEQDRLDEERRKKAKQKANKGGRRLKDNKAIDKKEKENKNKKEKRKAKEKTKKKLTFKTVILTIIEIVLFGIIVYSGYYVVRWYLDNKSNNQIKEELTSVVTEINTEDGEEKSGSLDAKNYDIDFDKLHSINSDTVGWLKVNNTDIEYSVVKGKDNAYYLDKSFNKKYNGAGWIFADFRNKFDGTDKNIIIYGHNRKDGSMFGTLKDTLQPEWYTNSDNKTLVFITENEKSNYEVFSVYMIPTEDYYITTRFTTKEFKNFVQRLKKRSAYDFGVEVDENDSILTLSTCAGSDYRTVLHAKKVVNQEIEEQ